jgi:hypothetical protein
MADLLEAPPVAAGAPSIAADAVASDAIDLQADIKETGVAEVLDKLDRELIGTSPGEGAHSRERARLWSGSDRDSAAGRGEQPQ